MKLWSRFPGAVKLIQIEMLDKLFLEPRTLCSQVRAECSRCSTGARSDVRALQPRARGGRAIHTLGNSREINRPPLGVHGCGRRGDILLFAPATAPRLARPAFPRCREASEVLSREIAAGGPTGQRRNADQRIPNFGTFAARPPCPRGNARLVSLSGVHARRAPPR